MFIEERGGRQKGVINWLLPMLQPGSNLQSRYVLWQEIEPATFMMYGPTLPQAINPSGIY